MVMNNTTAPAATTTHCSHRDGALGCARIAGHEGAHWLTSQPDAAHKDLRRNGFWSRLVEREAVER